MTTVRTGGVLGTLAGGAAAVRGLATKKTIDTSMPAMTTSKPVFQVYLSSDHARLQARRRHRRIEVVEGRMGSRRSREHAESGLDVVLVSHVPLRVANVLLFCLLQFPTTQFVGLGSRACSCPLSCCRSFLTLSVASMGWFSVSPGVPHEEA